MRCFNELTGLLDKVENWKDFLNMSFLWCSRKKYKPLVYRQHEEELTNNSGEKFIEMCRQYVLNIWDVYVKHRDIT